MKIQIGGGFKIRGRYQKHIHPDDKLETFLNIDLDDNAGVERFCELYAFLPRDLRGGIIEGFNKEFNKFAPVAKRVLNGTFTQEDIDVINIEISGIKPVLNVFNRKQAEDLNDELENSPKGENEYISGLTGKTTTKYLDISYQYPNTLADLYVALIQKTKSKYPFRNCLKCGKYFTPSPRNLKQIFCRATCKDAYYWHQRKSK